MRRTIKTLLVAGSLIFAGTVAADIPGLFVVQESRIADPLLGPNAERSGFGGAGMDFIGDVDGDGVLDVVAGAPTSPKDTGSIVILRLQKDGKVKGDPMSISAFDPLIKPKLLTKPKWGTGIAVAKGFSGPGSCAVVVTSLGNSNSTKIWALNVCVGNGAVPAPYISNAVVIDSTASALSGLRMKNGGVGRSLAVLDVTSDGNVILGVGSHNDGADASTYEGRVIILELNPTTLAFTRRAAYPESYAAADPVAQKLSANETFGWSLAPFHGANGAKGMFVVSSLYAPPGSTATGRVSLITFDSDYKMASWKTISGLSSPSVSGAPMAVATADFNRDGNSDLVVGFSTEAYSGGGVSKASLGSIQIAAISQNGDVLNSTMFKKDQAGFIDTGNTLGAQARFGNRLIAGDFDKDGQVDVVVGSSGTAPGATPDDIVGTIWPLRMKMAPWRKKSLDRVTLTNKSSGPILLKDYISGNRLGWTLKEDQTVPTVLDSCAIVGQSDTAALWCFPRKTNGESKWMAIAADSGNIPSTSHLADTLRFVVQVKDQDSAPAQRAVLPKIVITEEQKDTAAIAFSKYFRDPENLPMTYTLTVLNNSTTGLFSKFYQSTNTDTLHLVGNPFHFGLCSLKVVVRDNANAMIEDTLVIQVSHVNHPPIALAYAFSVYESKVDTFTVIRKDSDPDGDAVTTTISKQPVHGVATITAAGAIRYVPTAFYVGADSIRYALHDKTDSAIAWVKFYVNPSTDPTAVYKPLRDTVVVESSAPIVISTDSLFFNGASRFAVGAYFPKSDCQNLATIDYVDASHRLTITPIAAKWGRCQIYMRAMAADSVASTMYLKIDSVPTPYRFVPDSVQMSLVIGRSAKLQLDSVDLDGDTMVLEAAKPLPAWISLSRYQVRFNPVASSDDTSIYISARKKYATGANALPTDTLKIRVRFGTGTVYKPLKDTTVLEGSDTIRISTDSLFFWGPSKFAVSDTGLKEDCKKIASVKYDDARRQLIIVPLPYQWGRCEIYLRAAVPDSLASSMFLKIDSAVSPYRFPVDSFSVFLTVDKATSYLLDSLDKDGDTLAYSATLSNGSDVPDWIKIDRFQVILTPTSSNWDEIKVLLQARKKHGVGDNALPTDTVAIYTRFNAPLAVKGRRIGGATLSFKRGSEQMEIRSGTDAARIEMMNLNGQILFARNLASNSIVSIDVSRTPHLVYLRLVEGSRTSIAPLFIHH